MASAQFQSNRAEARLRLESPALSEHSGVPDVYRAGGADHSPPVQWSGAPRATRTLALIVESPDASPPSRTHWVVYNIPATRSGLPEGVSHTGDLTDGTEQGENDFASVGWHGPEPRPGTAARYRFRLYALDAALPLGPGATREQVEDAMRGHALADSTLTVAAATPNFSPPPAV